MNQATATDLALEDAPSVNESFQADIESLSNRIADCVRSTNSFLADPINRGKAGRFSVSRITVGLFVLIVTVTLILNAVMLNAGATIVQLMICNAGLMILHLLASICIASDLARGKTHFLSERSHLARQFGELSDHMTDLLRERQTWIDELNRCKWSLDAEKLKAQLAAQEVQSEETKLIAAKSQIAEKQTELQVIEAKQSTAKSELQKSTADRDAAVAKFNELRAGIDGLQSQKTKLEMELQTTEASRASKTTELEQIELQLQSLGSKQAEAERQLSRIESEIETSTAKIAAQESKIVKQAESLADSETKLAQFKLEQTSIDAAIQASKATENELQSSIAEAQSQLQELRSKRDQQAARLNAAIASAEASLKSKQDEVVKSQAAIDTLTIARTQLEQEITREREVLQELTTKSEYAQHCNVQLINEAIGLELKTTQYRESTASAEAALENIQQQLVERTNAIDEMRADELTLEMRIANLLTQASKLECLAVATNASVSDAQAQQQAELSKIVAELQDQKVTLEKSLQEVQSQIESEKLVSKRITDEASQLRVDAEKSASDAQRRVEMLTEKAENLAEQVQIRSAELFSFKQELMELRAEVRDLEATKLELKEIDQELEALKLELADHRSQIAAANAQIAECEATSQSQQIAATAIQQSIAEFDTQLLNAQAQYQAQTQLIEQLKAEHDAFNAQNQSLAAQKVEIDTAIQHSLEAKIVASTELTALRDEAQVQIALIDQLQAKKVAIKTQLENMVQQSRDENTQASSQLGELRDQAQIQRTQIEQLEAERTAIECDVADLTASLQTLLAQRSQAETESSRLEELIASRIAMEDEVATLAANIDSLIHQQTVAIDTVEMHEQAVNAAELQLTALQEELGNLQREHTETQATYSQSQQELENTMKLNQAAAEEYAATKLEASTIENRIGELQTQLDLLNTQKNIATATLQQVIDEVSDAQSVAKQWATYIDSLKLEVESQRKTQAEMQRSIETLRSAESQAMVDMERATNEVESLFEQQVALRSSNKADEIGLRNIQLALDEAMQQQAGLQHELSDARKSLADLKIQTVEANAELSRVEEAVNAALHSQSTIETQIDARQTQLERLAADHESHLSRVRDLADEQAFIEASLIDLNRRLATSESEITTLESRKHQLDQDLQQKQTTIEIAAEQRAAIETEIAQLNTEIAALQLSKSELSKIEASCLERTATLNVLCEESAMEQARLNELTEQVTATQRSLDTLTTQQTSSESVIAMLEQQNSAIQQSLARAEEELQAAIESKYSVAKLIDNMDAELKQLTKDKASIDHQMQLVTEQVSAKSNELQVTEDKVAAAEGKAVELWSTISELQALHADLEKALNDKREAVGIEKAEMIKFNHLREEILAQHDSVSERLAVLNSQTEEGQTAKREIERQISLLTLEVDCRRSDIAEANEQLELITKKLEAASVVANDIEPVEAMLNVTNPVAVIAEAVIANEEQPELSERTEDDPKVDSRAIAADTSQENDIWNTLGELARLGDVVRVESVDMNTSERSHSSVPLTLAETTPPLANPRFDEWETVFATAKAQRRA